MIGSLVQGGEHHSLGQENAIQTFTVEGTPCTFDAAEKWLEKQISGSTTPIILYWPEGDSDAGIAIELEALRAKLEAGIISKDQYRKLVNTVPTGHTAIAWKCPSTGLNLYVSLWKVRGSKEGELKPVAWDLAAKGKYPRVRRNLDSLTQYRPNTFLGERIVDWNRSKMTDLYHKTSETPKYSSNARGFRPVDGPISWFGPRIDFEGDNCASLVWKFINAGIKTTFDPWGVTSQTMEYLRINGFTEDFIEYSPQELARIFSPQWGSWQDDFPTAVALHKAALLNYFWIYKEWTVWVEAFRRTIDPVIRQSLLSVRYDAWAITPRTIDSAFDH